MAMVHEVDINTSLQTNDQLSPSAQSEYTVFEDTSQSVSPAAIERNYAGTDVAWPGMNDSLQDRTRPGWYVSRANGLFVPLIALDELPETIQLRDVPRYMMHWQTAGMEFLGEFPASGHKYETVHADASMLRDRWQDRYAADAAPDNLKDNRPGSVMSGVGSQYESAMSMHSIGPSRIDPPGLPHANRSDDDLQNRIDEIVHSNTPGSNVDHMITSLTPRPLPPSGREPDLGRKVYCTYWVSSGECNYTQQGCLYKHEMPDRATLAKIGFRTTPRWWQERRAQGLEPMQKAGLGQEGLNKQRQHHGRSGSEEGHGSEGTDSTGSLRLGNPDSQRFKRSKLDAKVDAMGRCVRGRGDAMASRRPPGGNSQPRQRGRFRKPEPLLRGRWPKGANNGLSSQLHSRRESTASMREMKVLNATDPPLLPLQSSSSQELRLRTSPGPSIPTPPLISPRSHSASIDSEIAITAPPSSPAILQHEQDQKRENGKGKSKGIYDPKTQQIVSPSLIHKPLFINNNTKEGKGSGECKITELNRCITDAAVSRVEILRVSQDSSSSNASPTATATAAGAASKVASAMTTSTAAFRSQKEHAAKGPPHVKAKAKGKGKAKVKATTKPKSQGVQKFNTTADAQDDLLLQQGALDSSGRSSTSGQAGGAAGGAIASGSGSGSGPATKKMQQQQTIPRNRKGQGHKASMDVAGVVKKKGKGTFRETLVSE